MEFLCSFPRSDFVGEPVEVSENVDFSLRLHLTQWQNLHLGPLDWGLVHSSNHSTLLEILQMLNPWVSQATNINILPTKSIYHQGKRLWELTKWSPKLKCFHLPSNSFHQFLRKIYGHQSGELISYVEITSGRRVNYLCILTSFFD